MTSTRNLPRLNRTDYYTRSKGHLLYAIVSALREHAKQHAGWNPSEEHRALSTLSRLLADVPNGGFTQFFYNNRGDDGVNSLTKFLSMLDFPEWAEGLTQAGVVYRKHASEFQTENPWKSKLFGSLKEYDSLDEKFSRLKHDLLMAAVDEWTLAHLNDLVVGDDGKSINVHFTGTHKAFNKKGDLHIQLDVRDGAAHGTYREFFEDGTVRFFKEYVDGKLNGEHWPNGQVKRRETVTEAGTTIETFRETGEMKERSTKEPSSRGTEKVQRFHSNGQLSEEFAKIMFKKRGPWVKFFANGSPKLLAEFKDDGTLVVRHAWDDEGRQIVRDGNGVFEEGTDLETDYGSFRPTIYRKVSHLVNGVPHGTVTTYKEGVLYETANFHNGKKHGQSTTYWENGKKRRETGFANGEEINTETYPKFDRPTPVVLLEFEADKELYQMWVLQPLVEYPVPLNLEEVQRQIAIPEFLHQVHARNREGKTKSRYEDCSTFNDSITYRFSIDAKGNLAEAEPTGSGTYSGGQWNTYIPILKMLKFSPARNQAGKVECLALARVVHTFVEG